jgi:hypothetical protein
MGTCPPQPGYFPKERRMGTRARVAVRFTRGMKGDAMVFMRLMDPRMVEEEEGNIITAWVVTETSVETIRGLDGVEDAIYSCNQEGV